jgi:hypothetical protein
MMIVTTSEQYYDQVGKEIDYDETGGEGMVPMQEAEEIQHILTCECSIYLLRRHVGWSQVISDDMIALRRIFIEIYEQTYDKIYIEYNDFY